MLDKQNKRCVRDSMETKHTLLFSWARENSVLVAPPSQPQHVWSGPAIELCLMPGFHPEEDVSAAPRQAKPQVQLIAGLHPASTWCKDSRGSSMQSADCWEYRRLG